MHLFTYFWQTITLIGALGLFLYGMKLMSEALQKVAGSKMRHILGAMTNNRFKGAFTGLLVTTTIQSSSATTAVRLKTCLKIRFYAKFMPKISKYFDSKLV